MTLKCKFCNKLIEAKSRNKKFCDSRCTRSAYRSEHRLRSKRHIDKKRQTEEGRKTLYNTSKAWSFRNKEKRRAYGMVLRALKSGRLSKEKCLKCDRIDVHAHHYDYSLPLNVVWLCPTHHFEQHRKFL